MLRERSSERFTGKGKVPILRMRPQAIGEVLFAPSGASGSNPVAERTQGKAEALSRRFMLQVAGFFESVCFFGSICLLGGTTPSGVGPFGNTVACRAKRRVKREVG
jgi:hypothetical protein